MLVLTRKLDEAIRIGGDIKITILRVKGNTVRIGIEAPREVRVVRDELDSLVSAASTADHSARRTAIGAAMTGSGIVVDDAVAAPRFDLIGSEELLSCELPSDEDGAVVTTVVDSPKPSTSRLFVGKARPHSKVALSEHEGSDQAAPLRAFLRSGRNLQAAG
jgi:carbon storage regulator CsrA